MKRFETILLILIFVMAFENLYPDLTGQARIRNNVDKKIKGIDLAAMSQEDKANLYADRFRLNINMIIPIYGSSILDTKLYGNVRPPAYIFDWFLGGIVPLIAIGIAAANVFPSANSALVVGGLTLYGLTRIGVYIAINEHIGVYNHYLDQKFNKPDSIKKVGILFRF